MLFQWAHPYLQHLWVKRLKLVWVRSGILGKFALLIAKGGLSLYIELLVDLSPCSWHQEMGSAIFLHPMEETHIFFLGYSTC